MATDSMKTRTEVTPFSIPVPVTVGAIVVALGFGGWAFYGYWAHHHTPPPAVLTPEARQYVHSLELSDVEIKATENYMKQKVVEIVGKIANTGPRRVSIVEINCVFRDAYGQVVLRQKMAIVGRAGGLAPGDKKGFRLAFDDIPESWNQGMPDLVIAHISFS